MERMGQSNSASDHTWRKSACLQADPSSEYGSEMLQHQVQGLTESHIRQHLKWG